MNECRFIGEVSRDLQLYYMASGTPVCEFEMAAEHQHGRELKKTMVRIRGYGRVAEEMYKYKKNILIGMRVDVTTQYICASYKHNYKRVTEHYFKLNNFELLTLEG